MRRTTFVVGPTLTFAGISTRTIGRRSVYDISGWVYLGITLVACLFLVPA
jgi:hypothetical protein